MLPTRCVLPQAPDIRSGKVRFAVFEADLRLGELRREGKPIGLQEKPLQILLALLENPGVLVTREELRRRLWPTDTFLGFDEGLNTAVRKLRQVLNDSADAPRYIETIPKRGYRFIATVDLAPEGTRWSDFRQSGHETRSSTSPSPFSKSK